MSLLDNFLQQSCRDLQVLDGHNVFQAIAFLGPEAIKQIHGHLMLLIQLHHRIEMGDMRVCDSLVELVVAYQHDPSLLSEEYQELILFEIQLD